jgi:hypothetical protein
VAVFGTGFFFGVFFGATFAGFGCSGARSTTFRRPPVNV